MRPIIEPTTSLTFSDYYALKATVGEVAQHFGYSLEKDTLALPQPPEDSIETIKSEAVLLEKKLHAYLQLTNLDSETARREILISPLLLKLLDIAKPELKIEYSLFVSEQLKGSIDYYLTSVSSQILVIEAKLADIERGFKQLIAELVAVQQWQETDLPLYGAVTTGEVWRFGILEPQLNRIRYALQLYREPQDLVELMGILTGILALPQT